MIKSSTTLVSNLQNKFLKECGRLDIIPSSHNLIVSIFTQELYHYYNNSLIRIYTISTSEKQPSCIQDSLGTPWGMHLVAEKIGKDAESGMVFKQRKPIGQKYWEYQEHAEDQRLVTTRILWLKGLEPGLNQGNGVDSYHRYIYIHGTNREHLLGSPATLGCITLANEDVITLYDSIPCQSLVWINPS